MSVFTNTLNESKTRLNQLQTELTERAEKLRNQFTIQQDLILGRVRETSYDQFYSWSGAATRAAAEASERLPLLGKKLQASLNERAEQLDAARDALSRPALEGYDELNVREITAALENLSAYEIEKIRLYEQANKNRVTVIRAADERLSA